MKNTAQLTLVSLGLAVLFAGCTDRTIVNFEETEDELVAYIAANTKVKVTNDRPKYIYVSQAELNERLFGAAYTGDGIVLGLQSGHQIILPIGYDPREHPEVLLHELFHFFSETTGFRHTFTCFMAEEAAAYRLQNKYVNEVMNGYGYKGVEEQLNILCPFSN